MLKKNILLGIAALGLSAVAFANGEEMPVAAPMEFNPGIYVGIQAGFGFSGWDKFGGGFTGTSISDEDSFAGRIFLGYDFHPNFAVELGYMMLSEDATINMINGPKFAEAQTQAVDLLAKLKIPFNDVFGVYTKVGAGYLMTRKLREADPSVVAANAFIFDDDNFNRFDVAYGLGFNYNITPNVTIDLSWMEYNGRSDLETNLAGQLTSYQPNADLFLLGISYKFDM